jgi:ABC-2 type transport system ATP-binding protein
MKDDPIISFTHVSKTYRGDLFSPDQKALRDLSLAVCSGEVLGVIGPNGAGKSTTLKILLGFVRYDSGQVTLAGLPPTAPEAHSRLGYLPENPCLYDRLTITEQLRFAARVTGLSSSEARIRIGQVLERVDLRAAATIPIRKFSKGMTQRAALAYALLHDPDILILDEPMSGLDPLGREMVVDIIREYRSRRKTILFCSHILTDVERICTRIGIMNRGRLISDLQPADLPVQAERFADKSPLEAFFLDSIARDPEGVL